MILTIKQTSDCPAEIEDLIDYLWPEGNCLDLTPLVPPRQNTIKAVALVNSKNKPKGGVVRKREARFLRIEYERKANDPKEVEVNGSFYLENKLNGEVTELEISPTFTLSEKLQQENCLFYQLEDPKTMTELARSKGLSVNRKVQKGKLRIQIQDADQVYCFAIDYKGEDNPSQ